MKEIMIDFTFPTPRVSSPMWGLVGEHNNTVLKCLLDDSFMFCDYINAEFELEKGKKIVVEDLEKIYETFDIHITQQISSSQRVGVQLVGYQMAPLTLELSEIAKTPKIYGFFGESVMGTEIEVTNAPSFIEQVYAKASQAYDLANHSNIKTLASLYREDLENMIITNHLGAHYLSCGGAYLRYCSDGSVISSAETVTENDKSYLRLHLNHGPLFWGNVPDFIDVPISNAEDKVDINSSGITLNGTSLDLGFSSLEEKVNELDEIPVVASLPKDATEGDLCLYSAPNSIIPGDKRFYINWDEFTQAIEEGEIQANFSLLFKDKPVMVITAIRNPDASSFFSVTEHYDNGARHTRITFDNGNINPNESYVELVSDNESVIEKYFDNISELPLYIQLPYFDSCVKEPEDITTPMIYSPYRLMVYQFGEWVNIYEQTDSSSNPDLHSHSNIGTLNALRSELFDGGIILGYPSPYLKFNGKNLRFCNDGYVVGSSSTVEENGRTYKRINIISGKSYIDITGNGIETEVESLADTIDIPLDTVSVEDLNAAISSIDNHSHPNKSVIDCITQKDIDAWNSIDNHSHANKHLIDTISESNINDWNTVVVPVSTEDNGKFMKVVNGKWQAVNLEFAAIYTGRSTPTNDIGTDGDIYIQTE